MICPCVYKVAMIRDIESDESDEETSLGGRHALVNSITSSVSVPQAMKVSIHMMAEYCHHQQICAYASLSPCSFSHLHAHNKHSQNPTVNIHSVDDDDPDVLCSLNSKTVEKLAGSRSHSLTRDRDSVSPSPVMDSSGGSGGGSPIPPYFHR